MCEELERLTRPLARRVNPIAAPDVDEAPPDLTPEDPDSAVRNGFSAPYPQTQWLFRTLSTYCG